MKKKIIISTIILFLVALAFFSFYIVKTSNTKKQAEKTANITQEPGSDFDSLFNTDGDTSLDLINIALTEEKIDRETMLIYKNVRSFWRR